MQCCGCGCACVSVLWIDMSRSQSAIWFHRKITHGQWVYPRAMYTTAHVAVCTPEKGRTPRGDVPAGRVPKKDLTKFVPQKDHVIVSECYYVWYPFLLNSWLHDNFRVASPGGNAKWAETKNVQYTCYLQLWIHGFHHCVVGGPRSPKSRVESFMCSKKWAHPHASTTPRWVRPYLVNGQPHELLCELLVLCYWHV